MSDTTFRKAEPAQAETKPAEAPVAHPGRGVGDHGVEPPISHYHEVKGVPYTAKYFEATQLWNNPDLGMKKEVLMIEKAYQRKVERNELRDGKDTFDHFIKQAAKATSTEMSPVEVKIAKIARYIALMNDMRMSDLEVVK